LFAQNSVSPFIDGVVQKMSGSSGSLSKNPDIFDEMFAIQNMFLILFFPNKTISFHKLLL